jgi:hemerythrin-like domain-containing protein
VSDIPPEEGTIIELLARDHVVIRGLIGRFDRAPTDEWGAVFRDLEDYLVRHERAEEQVVYPRLRSTFPKGDPVIDGCLEEQRQADELLAVMERMSPMAPEFRDAIGKLRDALDAHIAREDQVILPMIRSLGAHEDRELASRYEVARAEAAARPEAAADTGG